MVSNPEMKPSIADNGAYLNPIKGVYEKAGSPHLFLEHTEKGVSLKMFIPQNSDSWDTLKIYEVNLEKLRNKVKVKKTIQKLVT